MQTLSESQAQSIRGGGGGLVIIAAGLSLYGAIALIKWEWRPWKWC
ncbi:hypothetical protein [Stenotrophomonas maltophilia]|nr:hypothetical protein [Stenotrophomonas maltophilia]